MGSGDAAPPRRRGRGRHAVGTRRRADAVAVDGEATISGPSHFNPGQENCRLEYSFRRGHDLQGQMVHLTIKNRDDETVYHNGMLGLGADRSDHYDWNGQDTEGNLVSPIKSPFTAEIRIGNTIRRTCRVNVDIRHIHVWTRQRPKIMMNTPETPMDVAATVTIRKTDGSAGRARMPIDVKWSFEAGANNMAVADSYEYNTGSHLKLGKKNDANAVLWEANPTCQADTSSDDSYHETCVVKTITSGSNRGKAFVKFKSSGAGGDTYRLLAKVYRSDGTTVVHTGRSRELTVWRSISFTAYEMQHSGQNHVSTHGTSAVMASYYTNDTYVEYDLGRVTAIGNRYCVKYIGLWDHANTRMHNWNTMKQKQASNNEVPSAADIPKSNLPGANAAEVAARDAARARIVACAERWRDRIIDAYNSGLRHWASDAGVPRNTMVAIEYEHPKYSAAAPNSDSITTEWDDADLQWLRIDVEGTDVHPDDRWVNGQGVSIGGRAYITAGMSRARTRVTIAHEAGHETKNQFERARFRPASSGGRAADDDHTPGAGLMYRTANRNRFTNGEKDILRGKANP